MAASIAEPHVAQLESIKALSILRGLQLCMHQGFSNLIIESDCLLVVEEILKHELSYSIFGNIFLDIKDLMSHFCNCKVQ